LKELMEIDQRINSAERELRELEDNRSIVLSLLRNLMTGEILLLRQVFPKLPAGLLSGVLFMQKSCIRT